MKIEVKNVVKKFKDTIILENINLTFEEGHIYGFVGRNGSGKSILLKMICAFCEPTEGCILFNQIDIIKEQKYPPSTRALIEKPKFLPDLTGRDNLSLLASIQNKISEERIDEILEKLDLMEDKDKKYHKYSLGMKQKLGIAQVLMEDPKVMVLDEPFNGLDENSAKKIRNILIDEKKRGKIILIATHMKEDIEKLCDVVYRIEKGRIEEI